MQSAAQVYGIEPSKTSQRRCFRLRPGLCLPVSSFASSRRRRNVQRQDCLLLPTRSSLAVVLHLGFFLSSFLLGKSRLRLFQGLISESLIVTLFSHIPRSPDNPTGGLWGQCPYCVPGGRSHRGSCEALMWDPGILSQVRWLPSSHSWCRACSPPQLCRSLTSSPQRD